MLSVIIVNFRSASLIVDSIHSIRKFNQGFSPEIIVVDNNSGDNSQLIITGAFPETRWIQMGYNAGFARANNAGMKAAKGDHYLLLNPDTLSIDDSIQRCYERLGASSHIAAGVQLLDASQQEQISGSHFMKGGLNHLLPLPYWGNFLRWIAFRAKAKAPSVMVAGEEEKVDWISGAFLMVKKEAVTKAGMMDEDFFLYAEEVEWCSRLRKAGSLCIYGDLHLIHLEGGVIDTEQQVREKGYYNLYDKKGLQLMVSNHLRVRKQYGIGWFLFLLLNYTWGIFFFWIASTLDHLFRLKNPFADWKKLGAFAANVGRLWMLSPKIIANRPHFYKMF